MVIKGFVSNTNLFHNILGIQISAFGHPALAATGQLRSGERRRREREAETRILREVRRRGNSLRCANG